MDCTVRILKEFKIYKESEGNPTFVKLYCPIMGEVVLSGEEAENALKKIKEEGCDWRAAMRGKKVTP